jgi:predicted PolB exonuclease-like 3'-5' exonuclease
LPSSVKYGNTKDPEKRKAIDAKAETDFWAGKEKWAALDPHTAEVCAIGIGYSDEDSIKVLAGSEKEILTEFWASYQEIKSGHRKRKNLVGWNILGFDIPFMIKRSRIIGVPVPAMAWRGRYADTLFVDAKAEYYLHEYGWQRMAGLKTVTKVLGCSSPREYEVSGATFAENFLSDDIKKREQALAYLHDDILETKGVAARVI